MADRKRMASFLGISASFIPSRTEDLRDPKAEMVRLAGLAQHAPIRLTQKGAGWEGARLRTTST